MEELTSSSFKGLPQPTLLCGQGYAIICFANIAAFKGLSQFEFILIQSINTQRRSRLFQEGNMARDKMIGAGLLGGAVIGIIIYLVLMFDGYALPLLEITASVAVIAVLAILGWIGYVMATTPPPVPLEQEQAPTTAEAQPQTSEKK